MIYHQKNLDDLEKGIKSVLSQDRCSFSDEEKVLLQKCLGYVQQARKLSDQTGKLDFGVIVRIIEIMLQLFLVAEHLKELF